MGRTVLVCGPRKYRDRQRVYDTLSLLHALDPITRLVEGGAPGVDRFAKDWRMMMLIDGRTYEADWNNISHPRAVVKTRLDGTMYDITAGPRRNRLMFDTELPDLVVGFLMPTEKCGGTKHMIGIARDAGTEVLVVQ